MTIWGKGQQTNSNTQITTLTYNKIKDRATRTFPKPGVIPDALEGGTGPAPHV